MQQDKRPVPEYYFSQSEWDRLGCGPLPPERDRDLHKVAKSNKDHQDKLGEGNE